MGEVRTTPPRVNFGRRFKPECHGSGLSSNAGLLAWRDLVHAIRLSEAVTRLYNRQGTAEQYIKVGKKAINRKRGRRAYARPLDGQLRLTLS